MSSYYSSDSSRGKVRSLAQNPNIVGQSTNGWHELRWCKDIDDFGAERWGLAPLGIQSSLVMTFTFVPIDGFSGRFWPPNPCTLYSSLRLKNFRFPNFKKDPLMEGFTSNQNHAKLYIVPFDKVPLMHLLFLGLLPGWTHTTEQLSQPQMPFTKRATRHGEWDLPLMYIGVGMEMLRQ